MSNCHFSEGTKRILREHPALPAPHTRELAAAFVEAQAAACRMLALLGYPLERVALELKAGSLPYFREGADQDRKRSSGKKASYRFAGFTPSLTAEFEARAAERRSGAMTEDDFQQWQAFFLMRFTFEVVEQVALRVSPAPGLLAGEAGGKRLRWQVADAMERARRLRDQLLGGNLLLAAEVAIRRGRCYPGLSLDELFSAGTDGLLIALNRYDPAVGSFSTYAMPWIKMAMDRHAAKTRHVIRIPIGVQEQLRRRARAAGDGAPAPALPAIPQMQSLEEPLPGAGEGELRLEDVVADGSALRPADAAERADTAVMLEAGLRQLDGLKRLIIGLRSDLGDAAELGAAFLREEAALSLARGRAIAEAAARTLDEPARIRRVSEASPEAAPAAPSRAAEAACAV